MKKLKIWSMMMLVAMMMPMMVACGGGDDEKSPDRQIYPEGELSPDNVDALYKLVGINPEKYEIWESTIRKTDDNNHTILAAFEKGTEILHTWWVDWNTGEVREYKGNLKRTMDADLGYGEHVTLEIKLEASGVSRQPLEIEGTQVLTIIGNYQYSGPDHPTTNGKIVRLLFMTKNGAYAVKDWELVNDGGLKIMKWYNNSVAVTNVPQWSNPKDDSEPSTIVYSSQGKLITSFMYNVAYYSDIEEKVLEMTDYDKCIMFEVYRYDNNGTPADNIIFNFIDFTKSTPDHHHIAMSIAQAVLIPKISGNDNKTKYSTEIIESNNDYCKARMHLLEYNGEKKSYVFKINKTGNKSVELVD